MRNEVVPTEILADIPFRLDAGNLMSRVHMEPGSEDEEEFCALLVCARERARPKAAYRLCFIDARGEDSVTIEGVRFRSRAMRMNLADTERVFAYVATCGYELDELQLPAGDMLAEFWLDSIKAVLLGAAIAHLVAHLKKRFGLAMFSRAGEIHEASARAATHYPFLAQRIFLTPNQLTPEPNPERSA